MNFQLKKWTERNEQLEDDKDWESMSFNMNKNRVLDWLDEKWDEIDDDCPEEKMARYKMLKLCQSIVDSFPAEEYKPERAGDGN